MTTPWEYVENWACKRLRAHADDTLDKLNGYLQTRWPGKYKVIAKLNPAHGGHLVFVFLFDNPAEETMFRLKWA